MIIILENFVYKTEIYYKICENTTIRNLKNIICEKLNYNYKKLNMKIINTKNNKFHILSYESDDDKLLNIFSKTDLEFIKISFMDYEIFTRTKQYLFFIHKLCLEQLNNTIDVKSDFVIIQKHNGDYYQYNEFLYFIELVKTTFPKFVSNSKLDNIRVLNFIDEFILKIKNVNYEEYENIKYKNYFVYFTNQIFI